MEGLVEGFLRAAAKGNGTRERDRERVMCAVFPGPLYVSGGSDVEGEGAGCARGSEELETGLVPIQIQGMELDLSDVGDYDDDGMGDWAAFDYDESRGRVVLASSYGRVLVLEV